MDSLVAGQHVDQPVVDALHVEHRPRRV
jgi:hypothetical protein